MKKALAHTAKSGDEPPVVSISHSLSPHDKHSPDVSTAPGYKPEQSTSGCLRLISDTPLTSGQKS